MSILSERKARAAIVNAQRAARDKLLWMLWPTDTHISEITRRMNELPGREITAAWVEARSNKLKIYRPITMRGNRAKLMVMFPPPVPAPPPVPVPVRSAPVPPPVVLRTRAMVANLGARFGGRAGGDVETPIVTDEVEVAEFAVRYGLPWRGWGDLPAVNARRDMLLVPRLAKPLPCHRAARA